MDLFNGDFSISGDYAPDTGSSSYDGTSSAFATQMFGTPSLLTDGEKYIDSRANSSFFTFDQSKLTNSLFDVLKSGSEAAIKSGLQLASDKINSGSQQNNMFGSFLNNFRSTKTGGEIAAASYASKAQSFISNPMVWLGLFGIVAILLIRKG